MSADVGALIALNRHIGGDGEISDLKSVVVPTGKGPDYLAQCGLPGGRGKDVVIEKVAVQSSLEPLNGYLTLLVTVSVSLVGIPFSTL